jgi:methylmalonyl-CoA/ethylmalonyl-CoA epimerase
MLNFHHVGLLVENLGFSIHHYSELFGERNISKIYKINSQKVNVCFVKVGDDTFIELVEPIGEDSVVSKLLKKRISYYHVGYKVSNILAEVKKLEKLNYKAMDFFNSEAFDGKRCVFLFNPDAHLIELIED